jgi:hypothetical protein
MEKISMKGATMTTLEKIAATALRKWNGDIDKAVPHFLQAVRAAKLIDDLARDYLSRIAGRGQGHEAIETQKQDADPAPSDTGSIKVREHEVRQHRRRTQAEKEAAERAMMASAEAIYEMQIEGRAIGNIAIGELASLKRDLIDDASHKLMLGAEQVRNAVLAELIEQHGNVQDQLTRVRDAVSASTLNSLLRQAEQEAPRRIAEAMRHAAAAIEHAREIAA